MNTESIAAAAGPHTVCQLLAAHSMGKPSCSVTALHCCSCGMCNRAPAAAALLGSCGCRLLAVCACGRLLQSSACSRPCRSALPDAWLLLPLCAAAAAERALQLPVVGALLHAPRSSCQTTWCLRAACCRRLPLLRLLCQPIYSCTPLPLYQHGQAVVVALHAHPMTPHHAATPCNHKHMPAPAHASINTLWPPPAGLDGHLPVTLVTVKVLLALDLLLALHQWLHHFASPAQRTSTQPAAASRNAARETQQRRVCMTLRLVVWRGWWLCSQTVHTLALLPAALCAAAAAAAATAPPPPPPRADHLLWGVSPVLSAMLPVLVVKARVRASPAASNTSWQQLCALLRERGCCCCPR